jgi:hypothetical protein
MKKYLAIIGLIFLLAGLIYSSGNQDETDILSVEYEKIEEMAEKQSGLFFYVGRESGNK